MKLSRRLRVEQLEPRVLLAGDTYLVNFQLDSATAPNRYAVDTGEVFGDRGNGLFYGWSNDHTDVSRDRGVNADQRLDTLIHFHQNQTWEFALPNGDYEVTASIGDSEFASTHTLNVEGSNYWTSAVLNPNEFLVQTTTVSVSDGRLTLDQGLAPEKATRVNYLHIVNVPNVANTPPNAPAITEPVVVGEIVNPFDVHLEGVGFSDADGDQHQSSDWEIWTVDSSFEIYSDINDGFVEVRTTGGPWPQVHPETFGSFSANTGEWFGNDGLTSIVLPFQLPDFGAVNNPFSTADLGVHLHTKGTATISNVDLYGVRVDSLPAIATSDYYSGAAADPNATLIQADFLTPFSPASGVSAPNNFTNANGDSALANFLNASYAGGANAGEYVFLRLSYASDSLPNGWDGYQITTSEAGGGVGDYPVLSYTTTQLPVTGERVWQTLGIGGVERLHTHLGDGIFEGSHAGRNSLLPNTNYELRVRFRDDAGSVSAYSTRIFQTDVASSIFPLEIEDIASTPIPSWEDATGSDVVLPVPSPLASELRVESEDGQLLLSIAGNNGVTNTVTNPPELNDHAHVRLVVTAGTSGLTLGQTDVEFNDDTGLKHTVLLPSINLLAGQRLDLWVGFDGSTYFGTQAQTEPDFSSLARQADLPVPFIALEPGYEIEEVAGGLQLPVNIAFVPNPGPNPSDPLFYVNELYGTIKVVTNNFTISDYATGLLNFNPTGAFPGSGEQGLAGLVVDPATGDLFVTRVTDSDGNPGGDHHPQVVRLTSNDGGLTMATETVILDMVGESQGQSHQISHASIGPDGKLYIHNGDGFDATTALNLDSYRGKILRLNFDGSAPTDNPFYDASNGINSRDYIYAYGFRNPFGGAWRASDGELYEVENGNALDRLAQVERGGNYDWNGGDNSLLADAKYVWNPAHAPVNIAFVQPETFGGSQFPSSKQDRAFVSESGPTYAAGPQSRGKRIVEFEFDANGDVVSGPTTLVEYAGVGQATVVALAAGPDGLYFSELYKDEDAASPIDAGARIFRVRYAPTGSSDFDNDGDVDGADFLVWQRGLGTSNPSRSDGDANLDGTVDAADLSVWETNYGQPTVTGLTTEVGNQRSDLIDAILIDAAMALDWLNNISAEEPDFVVEPVTYQAVPVGSVFADYPSIPGSNLAEQRSLTKISKETPDSNESWLVEELLERVFG